ncbi:MAG: ATP synthase F1 subunit gamma [Flavobacteriales bacterium]|nr:ATP synthase F1 subunit gamma [Flavobacteriales bacterium]
MANLKEIRNRISSVGSTMQITSAMKMVSAAKLKRAQNAIVQMRPYASKLGEILSNLAGSLNPSENPYSAEREVEKALIIAIASNRGLAGAFNNNVIKGSNVIIKDNDNVKFSVLSLGKKTNDYFKKTSYNTLDSFGDTYASMYDELSFAYVSSIAEDIMERYVNGEYDKVYLVYNSFKNAGVQILRSEQFLPISPPEGSSENSSSVEYIFEPNKKTIVEDLIPKSLKIQLYKAVLDSHASEHGARMTAMHKATENATDLQKELKLTYNKARQAAITAEILEIVGGAEALNA